MLSEIAYKVLTSPRVLKIANCLTIGRIMLATENLRINHGNIRIVQVSNIPDGQLLFFTEDGTWAKLDWDSEPEVGLRAALDGIL